MVELKTPEEIEKMRAASVMVASTLAMLRKKVRPGVSTLELSQYAEERIKLGRGKPAFLGYRGYPAALCVSINDEIVHGIPSAGRRISEGDIVSLDLGVLWDGFYGDAAITVAVGEIKPAEAKLLKVTEQALYRAIETVKSGVHIGDVSHAIEDFVGKTGMGVVRDFTGHGIGRHLHEEPSIPNFGRPGTGVVLRPGMTLAIEPMVCLGGPDVVIKEDGWTAVSADGSYAAHFEHTVAVTENGCEILSSAPDWAHI